jgi:KamA family protein
MSEILTTQAKLVEATLATSRNRLRLSKTSPNPTEKWQGSLKSALRSGKQLLEAVELPNELGSAEAEADFPVFATLEYVSRMRKGDPRDPLLLQVLASAAETTNPIGLDDPVGDGDAELIPGLLKKYQRRALLITSGACAVHCRYCFRRHFPYQAAPKGLEGWQAAIAAIAKDDSIDEVILSGGDPLSVNDSSLHGLIGALNGIPHLRRIRIHTRFPVVIPSRVCDELLEWVSQSRCAVYVVLHINH